MKEYVCKKCGSLDVFVQKRGNQIGLFCSDCGKWIKWLPKNEVALAERYVKNFKQQKESEEQKSETNESIDYGELSNMETNESSEYDTMVSNIEEFIQRLDKEIDRLLVEKPKSIEDSLVKCAQAQCYEKDKNALINIINGKKYFE